MIDGETRLFSRLEREALHDRGVPQQLQRPRAVQDQPPGRHLGVLVRIGLVRQGLRHPPRAGMLRQKGQRRRSVLLSFGPRGRSPAKPATRRIVRPHLH